MLALDDVESADPGANVHADHVRVFWRDLQAGVLHRLVGGRQGEVDEASHLAGLFLLHEVQTIKVLNFGGNTD